MNKLLTILAKAAQAVGNRERFEGAISAVTKKNITTCINKRYMMSFYYTGDKDSKAGFRYVFPVVWGLNKFTKNNILRAYEYAGGGWKTFRLDRMKSTTPITTKIFNAPPPGYNPSGDGSMSEELFKVQFP